MQELDLQYAPIGVNPVVHISQYDVGRQFKLKIYDGATAYSMPSGTTARIDGLKPDKTAFSYSDAVSVSGNIVTVTTKDQMTVLNGSVVCEIRFSDAYGNDIGTLNFKLEVEKSPIDNDTPISDAEIPAIVELARNQMLNAEAWAAGTKGGIPVDETDPQYNNNSKYYSEQSALSGEAWATGTKNGVPVTDTEPQYHNNSKYYSEQSASSATASANSATASANSASASADSADDSADSATLSESWAVGGTGTRQGEDINNAYYWSLQAQSASQDVSGYIAILKLLLSAIYINTESGMVLNTESGDKLIMDF